VYAQIETPHIKQIAGRAGRYRTAASVSGEEGTQTGGLVTTLSPKDHIKIATAMKRDTEPIPTACIQPPGIVVERFASYFPPKTPFSFILTRLFELCRMNPRFHLADLKDQLLIADEIRTVHGLTIADRIVFCASPANPRQLGTGDDPTSGSLIQELAQCIADQAGGDILQLKTLNLEVLDEDVRAERSYLYQLELLHKGLLLYLWLSYRFPGVFRSRPVAFHVKTLAEEAIAKCLSMFTFDRKTHERIRAWKMKTRGVEGEEEGEGLAQLLDAKSAGPSLDAATDQEVVVDPDQTALGRSEHPDSSADPKFKIRRFASDHKSTASAGA
jgi:ATP-dependent RNA helicase SUPV3L1/SUV3